jgi:glycine betaine catabolism B
LPKDSSKKLAFLAGGVGITPFRSMAKYMIDSGEKRDAVLLYSASSETELSFQQLFSQAERSGLKTFYVTNGYLDQLKIKTLLPDFAERRFYISGPYGFVQAVETALLKLGVGSGEIITDYFPGYS